MNIENPELRDIFCLGDSITYGEWDESGGWVQRLRRVADAAYIAGAGPKTHIYNLGVSGHTSAQLLARAPAELAARVNPLAKTTVLIAIGMNDAHLAMPAGTPCATPEAFSENLRALAGLARRYTDHLCFMGLNPIDDRRTQPLPWNACKSYALPRVEMFNRIIAEIAAAEKADFIDVWSDWQGHNIQALLCDGLHPNAEGHARLAALIAPFLHLPVSNAAHPPKK